MAIDILNEATALIQAGKKAEAQKLLEPFIEANLHNIPAWLLEVETWPTVAQKKKVLELCLRHNPSVPQVEQALMALESPVSPIQTAADFKQPFRPEASPKSLAPPKRGARSIANLNKIILGCVLFIAIGFLGWSYLTAASCNDASGTETCPRVLFIGNSYTFVNDLPNMYVQLARSGGHKSEAEMRAEGGWTLSAHANSSETLDKLKSAKWDFVVLQEQSQIPSIVQSRIQSMYPAARLLVRQIEAGGARPIFFMTWAHRQGWPENGLPDYEATQFQIEQGYLAIAQELNAPIAPVGDVWLAARRQHPELDLWQGDGSHPNELGTYLAACVFYAVIFRQSPVGLTYTAHLPKETAYVLQAIAADVVLKNPKQWNLP